MTAPEKIVIALKEKLERAKSTKQEAEAELKHLHKRLRDEFDLDSVEAAEKELKSLEGKEEKLQAHINKKQVELEDKYLD